MTSELLLNVFDNEYQNPQNFYTSPNKFLATPLHAVALSGMGVRRYA